MANRNTHMLVGGALVLGLYIVHKKFIQCEDLTFKGVVASFATGAVLGIVPDMLEPAAHPNHRQFFHSVGFSAAMLWVRDGVRRSPTIDKDSKRYFDWALCAYGSHLICDSQTPKGLPFLGN